MVKRAAGLLRRNSENDDRSFTHKTRIVSEVLDARTAISRSPRSRRPASDLAVMMADDGSRVKDGYHFSGPGVVCLANRIVASHAPQERSLPHLPPAPERECAPAQNRNMAFIESAGRDVA